MVIIVCVSSLDIYKDILTWNGGCKVCPVPNESIEKYKWNENRIDEFLSKIQLPFITNKEEKTQIRLLSIQAGTPGFIKELLNSKKFNIDQAKFLSNQIAKLWSDSTREM